MKIVIQHKHSFILFLDSNFDEWLYIHASHILFKQFDELMKVIETSSPEDWFFTGFTFGIIVPSVASQIMIGSLWQINSLHL
ncbi:hypothetical protein M5K25_022551 [Dendrobium thyrsiflorum]|uniref:Uncharacterized protein n=1 Tax=Dendrobium thyrsiflorum TaxID=117978 RepID=A0ABD0UCM2_DENTH